ncbi:MAG TPA: type I glutamate--ammonia ligase [Alphaproteobacteria bacterium]|nr:type I glutamate--ammonia ligase [Alphaproteobacteria bacterium]
MSKKVLDLIKKNNVKYVDLRFTDPRGKWQHTAQTAHTITADTFQNGIMFDGSSIAGWKSIDKSDMMLMPDPETAVMDPFTAQPQLVLFCDVLEPISREPYNRDPRSVAKKAEAFLKKSGIGDKAYFGPEAEFFVFDDVRFDVSMNHTFYKVNQEEGPYNSGSEMNEGNLGHRPAIKGGYFPVPPVDSFTDLRAEMVTVMEEMGLVMEKHHHEVAPSQHELGLQFTTLTKAADSLQIYKYVTHMTAQAYGKTATFMPKPVLDDNGSGMHTHQSIFKGEKPLFAGSKYAGLSDTALHYIGGVMKHARAINAFSNATTNSYKRLIPGFEAPTLLAYSERNRSASCRIPYSPGPKGKRVEVRFPDASGNPYYTFAVMLMAGLDGIRKKIKPRNPIEADFYELSESELKGIPTVCASLQEAIDALDKDRGFLKQGDVFTDDMIDGYIELKKEEIQKVNNTPHPVEFELYYSV